VDRQLKKVAKSDAFKEEFWHGIDFLGEHPDEVKRYGIIAVVVIALAVGIFYYVRHQATVRQEALAQALRVDDSTIGPNVQAANLHFETEDQKRAAVTKAFSDVSAKYHGSQEAAIAGLYLAQAAADRNDLPQAEKL
jgi:hypothetical protein